MSNIYLPNIVKTSAKDDPNLKCVLEMLRKLNNGVEACRKLPDTEIEVARDEESEYCVGFTDLFNDEMAALVLAWLNMVAVNNTDNEPDAVLRLPYMSKTSLVIMSDRDGLTLRVSDFSEEELTELRDREDLESVVATHQAGRLNNLVDDEVEEEEEEEEDDDSF